LESTKKALEAEAYYVQALSLNPACGYLTTLYAGKQSKICKRLDFLFERKEFEWSEKFYELAVEVDPYSGDGFNNFGCFLANVSQDYEKSEKMFRTAVSLEPQNPIFVQNLITLLKSLNKNLKEIGDLSAKLQSNLHDQSMSSLNL
jgi:tetratricopeptide (TPR) repeat protein